MVTSLYRNCDRIHKLRGELMESIRHSCGYVEVPEIWLCYVGILIDGRFNQVH